MLIPENVLEEIKSHFDIAQFISRYVELKKAGANHKGLCPFHQEKTPSFMVSSGKGIFKCFGCGAGGNLFTFLRDIENISFHEAVRMLAKEAGIELSQYSTRDAEEKKSENERLYRINDAARAFFQDSLNAPDAEIAKEYLAKRELNSETIMQFSIGYASGQWEALLKHLRAGGFSEEDGIKAGLLVRRDDGRISDKFRNRIMFPIVNLSGLTAGFTGRVLIDADNPKYLNSPETPVFQKGKLLFGLFAARDSIRKESLAYIVEGNVDLITVSQAGIKNVVATSGTAFTETQALLLKRFCEQAVIVYDGDNAGLNAAQRGIPILINAGIKVRIVALPMDEDPDSFIKKNGADAFLDAAKNAKDVPDFIIDLFESRNDLSVPENKVMLVDEFTPFLLAVEDPLLKSEWIRKTAKRTGLREDLIFAKSSRQKDKPRGSSSTLSVEKPLQKIMDSELEERIISLLMHDGERNMPAALQHVKDDDFNDPSCRALFQAIVERNGFDQSIMNILDDKAREIAGRLAMENETLAGKHLTGIDINSLILKLHGNRTKLKRSELKRRLLLPGEDREKLMAEFNELTREINELKKMP